MRPYLAIIHDSFREALASRVLWILLILITLLLLLLAPFSYREKVTIDIGENDVKNWQQFIEQVKTDGAKDTPSPARHILEQFDEPLRQKIAEFKMPDDGDVGGAFKFVRTMREFRAGLNKQLRTPTFYDAEAWGKIRLTAPEAQELLQRDAATISDDERGRLNRLAFEAAFPESIESGPARSLQLVYLVWDLLEPMPVAKKAFQELLTTWVSVITNWIVGVFGVFVAVLMTAQIIPQTFDPGSLALLLSKPIMRGLVFLTKFVGGCAFIVINAAYLVGGLWIILGARFGIWDATLLLSIPIFMFVFAIYYSVSALTGVIWRNPIVSIALTMLFWGLCFLIGWSKITVDKGVMTKLQVTRVIASGDSLIAVNQMGTVGQWDAETQQWSDIFETDVQKQLRAPLIAMMIFRQEVPPEMKPIGPAYDAKREQLVSVQRSLRNGQMTTYIARKSREWKSETGTAASVGTSAVLSEPDGSTLVLSSFGMFRLTGDALAKQEPLKIFGFTVPLPTSGPYRTVGPEQGVLVTGHTSAAINQETGLLAIYTRGTLTALVPNARGPYEKCAEQKISDETGTLAVVAAGGNSLLVCFDDGRLVIFDADTLTARAEAVVDRSSQPRMIAAAPGGQRFAILFHNGKLWLFDAATQQLTQPQVTGQGDISGVSFSAPDRLLVADHTTRVSEYEVPSLALQRRLSPKMGMVEIAYRYVLVPLYTVFPKPGELDKTVQYLLTGKETKASNSRRGADLTAVQEHLHPWSPVWSGALFMVVTLGIGCLYIQRQEF